MAEEKCLVIIWDTILGQIKQILGWQTSSQDEITFSPVICGLFQTSTWHILATKGCTFVQDVNIEMYQILCAANSSGARKGVVISLQNVW